MKDGNYRFWGPATYAQPQVANEDLWWASIRMSCSITLDGIIPMQRTSLR
jgi:hypothetical protein